MSLNRDDYARYRNCRFVREVKIWDTSLFYWSTRNKILDSNFLSRHKEVLVTSLVDSNFLAALVQILKTSVNISPNWPEKQLISRYKSIVILQLDLESYTTAWAIEFYARLFSSRLRPMCLFGSGSAINWSDTVFPPIEDTTSAKYDDKCGLVECFFIWTRIHCKAPLCMKAQ